MSNKKLFILLLIMSLLTFTGCSKSDATSSDDTTSITQSSDLQIVNFTSFSVNGNTLPNVKINILENDMIVESIVTDNLGTANFKLHPGKYYYTIVSVPGGYVTDDIMYEFTVSTQEIEIEIEIEEAAKQSDY